MCDKTTESSNILADCPVIVYSSKNVEVGVGHNGMSFSLLFDSTGTSS